MMATELNWQGSTHYILCVFNVLTGNLRAQTGLRSVKVNIFPPATCDYPFYIINLFLYLAVRRKICSRLESRFTAVIRDSLNLDFEETILFEMIILKDLEVL